MEAEEGANGGTGRPQIFCIVVNRTDAPHFEYFRHNAWSVDHKRGLRDCDGEVWEEVEPGDIVYMWAGVSATIPICGRVERTELDPDVAKGWIRDEWVDRTRIIYFSHLRHTDIARRDFDRHARIPVDLSRTLFRVNDGSVDRILEEWPVNDPIFDPPNVALPVDLVSPPDGTEYDVARTIRETEGSRRLREAYGNRCQVCGHALKAASGSLHSEVHHLRPLHEGGTDTPDNMVVLCPAHHAELDYGTACVGESGLALAGGSMDGQRLHFVPDHRLAAENVAYGMRKSGPAGHGAEP